MLFMFLHIGWIKRETFIKVEFNIAILALASFIGKSLNKTFNSNEKISLSKTSIIEDRSLGNLPLADML